MTITRTMTDLFNGPATAGAILSPTRDLGTGDGTPAAMSAFMIATYDGGGSIFGGDSGGATTNYEGFRFATGGIDLSTRTYVAWQMAHNNNLSRYDLDTFANAGMRVVFDDGTNWAAYVVYGGDITPFSNATEGAFGGYASFGAHDQSVSACWFLDRDNRATYATSGTLNWASVTHIEVHFLPASSGNMGAAMGKIATADLPIFTGTTSINLFKDIRNTYGTTGYVYPWISRPAALYALSGFTRVETLQIGVQIGDGTTTTTLSESNIAINFWGTADDYTAAGEIPPNASVLVDSQSIRLVDVYQSATDNVSLADIVVSSQSKIGWRVRGNTAGTATFPRILMTALEFAELGHGLYAGGTWDSCLVQIEITADTAITDGIIRNSYGAKITGAAGDYSALTIRLDNNAVSDIDVGSGGAGTYTLSGITAASGYTLKIWNSSTTNAVTATFAAGTATQAIDLWFNYDNEASGPFSLDETLTFGNGATAKLVSLVDNGTTGTMYCELSTGSAPPDNNSITGGTSSATANVDEASGANSSTLTIDYAAATFTAANIANNANYILLHRQVFTVSSTDIDTTGNTITVTTDSNGDTPAFDTTTAGRHTLVRMLFADGAVIPTSSTQVVNNGTYRVLSESSGVIQLEVTEGGGAITFSTQGTDSGGYLVSLVFETMIAEGTTSGGTGVSESFVLADGATYRFKTIHQDTTGGPRKSSKFIDVVGTWSGTVGASYANTVDATSISGQRWTEPNRIADLTSYQLEDTVIDNAGTTITDVDPVDDGADIGGLTFALEGKGYIQINSGSLTKNAATINGALCALDLAMWAVYQLSLADSLWLASDETLVFNGLSNLIIDNVEFDETSGNLLQIYGANIREKDGNPIVSSATTGPVVANIATRGNVGLTETGISGLTAGESARLASIGSKTDQLTFTVANQVDANVHYVNDTQVAGSGVAGVDEWRPA